MGVYPPNMRVWMQAMSGNLYYLDGETIRPYWNNDVLERFKNRDDIGKGFIVENAGETVHISSKEYGTITIFKDKTTASYDHKETAYKMIFEKK